MNFWNKGKLQQKRFYDLKLKAKTNWLGTFLALFTSVLIFIPVIFVLIQFLFVYGYNRTVQFVFIAIIWICINVFNGILNYLSIRFSKSLEKDNQELQSIEEKYVFYYQLLNPVFAGLSLIIILFFAYQITGGL